MDGTEKIWFDATLRPHRSLGARGFLVLMTFVCAVSFVAGLVFFLMGAWPVVGFFGLDIAGIYWAFRLSYRSGELAEDILLTDNDLVIRRLTPRKAGDISDQNLHRNEWHFQPYWVRVLLEQPDEFQTRMILSSHGRRLHVGSFLSADETVSLAQALRQALALHRAGHMPQTA